jgi:ferredoxin-NADP reductase
MAPGRGGLVSPKLMDLISAAGRHPDAPAPAAPAQRAGGPARCRGGGRYRRWWARLPALLIAGGSGLAPIRALLESVPAGAVVIYRARAASDLVFREELDWLAARRRACVVYVLGTRREPGPRRLLTPQGLGQIVPDVRRREVYLLGPAGLVAASVGVLDALRVPYRQIHADPFGP